MTLSWSHENFQFPGFLSESPDHTLWPSELVTNQAIVCCRVNNPLLSWTHNGRIAYPQEAIELLSVSLQSDSNRHEYIIRVPTQIAFSNSVSDRNFSLCQFTWFVTITYTKLPYPDAPKKWKFSQQIPKYLLPLGLGNLQLEQTKFPVFSLCFGKIFKFLVFSLTGIIFWQFPCFPCGMDTLIIPDHKAVATSWVRPA